MDTSLSERRSSDNATLGDFPLAAYPSILLHMFTSYKFDPQDLARLEATCSSFKRPANFAPDFSLSMPEVAALDLCLKRDIFKSMAEEEREALKQRCGGSWKLVLKFLLAGEFSTRRGEPQAIAGPCDSIAVVSSKGEVYTFGVNDNTQENGTVRLQLIRSLQGIRIIQAAAGVERAMLVSNDGRVYALGRDNFQESSVLGGDDPKLVAEPQLVESLKDIFVVQATMGYHFAAVLSREGRVYILPYRGNLNDRERHPFLGPLENLLVVQIGAGSSHLAALSFQPHGLTVHTVGIPVAGMGPVEALNAAIIYQGFRTEHLNVLNIQPVCLAAGAWHVAVVGRDGRVCIWGLVDHGFFGYGCRGNIHHRFVPKVVSHQWWSFSKSVSVVAGVYSTFVVMDNGDVLSLGGATTLAMGRLVWTDDGEVHYHPDRIWDRTLVPLPGGVTEKIAYVRDTKSISFGKQALRHAFLIPKRRAGYYAFEEV